ncbi:hypothetical protein EB796_023276 [Bugula neritina]|uniref:Uncharacterized protein n=1 Tax=Bugula neritina TaxID=10212 RepID=A0A7J7IX36_BUGNE|nr:hypothetical protein EB796_023276 [Bugula neritina]
MQTHVLKTPDAKTRLVAYKTLSNRHVSFKNNVIESKENLIGNSWFAFLFRRACGECVRIVDFVIQLFTHHIVSCIARYFLI